jgi:hypothetical protein
LILVFREISIIGGIWFKDDTVASPAVEFTPVVFRLRPPQADFVCRPAVFAGILYTAAG